MAGEKPIERQEQMYPLTSERQDILGNLGAVSGSSTVVTFGEAGPHTLGEALKELIPDTDSASQEAARNAILAQAVAWGFNVSLVHPGDSISFESGYLKIDQADGRKYALPLFGEAEVPAGYEQVTQRENVKEETRRAWTNLDEAFKSGILVDILKAQGEDSSFAARVSLWDNVDGAVMAKLIERNPGLNGVDPDTVYQGSLLQNQALVEYLKMRNEEGSAVDAGAAAEEELPPPSEGGAGVGVAGAEAEPDAGVGAAAEGEPEATPESAEGLTVIDWNSTHDVKVKKMVVRSDQTNYEIHLVPGRIVDQILGEVKRHGVRTEEFSFILVSVKEKEPSYDIEGERYLSINVFTSKQSAVESIINVLR